MGDWKPWPGKCYAGGMKPLSKIFAGTLIIIAGLAYITTTPKTLQAQNPIALEPDNPQAVLIGSEIYKTACGSCHGPNLEGEINWRQPLPGGGFRAPPHDQTGHTWHHPDANLFYVTKLGREGFMATYMNQPGFKSDMPGFGDTYSDEEIIAVLSYIKSTWPAHIRAQHDQINKRSNQP